MTRSELVTALAYRFPKLMKADADMSVDHILGAISQMLTQGHRVEIRGFGTFSLNYRPPRIGRNPKTGETIHVPAHKAVKFKVSKGLKDAVAG